MTAGTAFNAELTAPVDSKKAKPGDRVKGRTTEPCKSNGKTVLPKGTQLLGHVTQATARTNGQAESALGIVFDTAILKDGQEVPLNVAIQALASAESSLSAAGSDLDTMGNAGAHAGASGMGAARGTLGGVTNTVTNIAGNTVDAATRTTSSVAGNAGAGVNGAVGGLNAAGQLSSNSRGVFGLNGLNLNTFAGNSTQGSVITSTGKNVHLDSGTKILLVAQSQASEGKPSNKPAEEREHPKPERGKPDNSNR